MNPDYAGPLALLTLAALFAAWRFGFDAGQDDVLKKFKDYCDQRKQENISSSRRDNRQS